MSAVSLFAAAGSSGPSVAPLTDKWVAFLCSRATNTPPAPVLRDVGFIDQDGNHTIIQRLWKGVKGADGGHAPLVQFFATCHTVSAEAIVQTVVHRDATPALILAVAAVLARAHPTHIDTVSKQLVPALQRLKERPSSAMPLDTVTAAVVHLKTAFVTAVHSGAVGSLALLAALLDAMVIVWGEEVVGCQDSVEAVNCVTALSREMSQWALEAASWRLGVATAHCGPPSTQKKEAAIRHPTAYAVRTSRAVEVTTEHVPLKRPAQAKK